MKQYVKFVLNHYGELIIKDIYVDVREIILKNFFLKLFYSDCQQAYHRECALNSEKCSKDRTKFRKFSNNRNPSSKLLNFSSCFFYEKIRHSSLIFFALRIIFS